MTSLKLEKSLKYLQFQENVSSENPTEYYLWKGIFLYVFFLSWKILCKHKIYQITELAKTWWLFAQEELQINVFCSMLMSMPA